MRHTWTQGRGESKRADAMLCIHPPEMVLLAVEVPRHEARLPQDRKIVKVVAEIALGYRDVAVRLSTFILVNPRTEGKLPRKCCE